MAATVCPACGTTLPDRVDACPDCGYKVRQPTRSTGSEPSVLICAKCQTANPADQRNCQRCGESLPAAPGTLLLGRYRLEQHLKTGGFGAIYLASDTKNPNQRVVIKEMIIPDPVQFKTRLNFFIREFEILRLLNEKRLPTVPRHYGFFQDEQERSAHLVMEFIPGRNLLEIMETNGNQPFDFPLVVDWGKTLCDVLAVMHGQNPPRIHRDVKPDNIMLLNDGRSIKMIDFGTAREVRDSSPLTRVYSEDYAPPEQVLGRPEPRSDLFALAATLYHLATGNVPKGVQTAPELAALLANQPSNVPRWFLELLQANLAVKVNERHPSALAFKEDLERQRVRSPGELYPSSPPVPPVSPTPVPQPPPPVTNQKDNAQTRPPEPSPVTVVWNAEPQGGTRVLVVGVVLLLLAAGGVFLGIRNDWFSQAGTWIASIFNREPGEGTEKRTDQGSGSTGRTSRATTRVEPVVERPFISRVAILSIIRKQLESARPEDRPYQRFFTLENLYNNKDISKEVLDQHRDALARLLGQYSAAALAPPRALGDGTVFQVDLRPLGWDQSAAWHKILAAYPYGLLEPGVEELLTLADQELPFVRADWFVATACQEPLFSRLAGSGKAPQLSESILKVQKTYQGELVLREAALELGLADPEDLRQMIKADSRVTNLLAKRTLTPLTRGEPVSRENWSAKGGLETPFQELAVKLGLASGSYRARE